MPSVPKSGAGAKFDFDSHNNYVSLAIHIYESQRLKLFFNLKIICK
jgi:hypothetical protein